MSASPSTVLMKAIWSALGLMLLPADAVSANAAAATVMITAPSRSVVRVFISSLPPECLLRRTLLRHGGGRIGGSTDIASAIYRTVPSARTTQKTRRQAGSSGVDERRLVESGLTGHERPGRDLESLSQPEEELHERRVRRKVRAKGGQLAGVLPERALGSGTGLEGVDCG